MVEKYEVVGIVKHRKGFIGNWDEYKLIEQGSGFVIELYDLVRRFKLENKIDGKKVKVILEVME